MLPIKDEAEEARMIFPSSRLFSVMGLITLALVYVKLSVPFYVRWNMVMSPMVVFFAIRFLESLWTIRRVVNGLPLPIPQLKLTALWSVSQMLITASLATGTIYMGDLVQKEVEFRDYHASKHAQKESIYEHEQHDISEPMLHLFVTFAFALIIYFGYSVAADSIVHGQEDGRYVINFFVSSAGQVLMNFVLSTLGNSVAVCSGGACNSFYVSTLSAFFAAFGVSITHFIHYLNYLCVALLVFSLVSLYSVKNSWRYGPFLLTLLGASMIACDMFFYDMNVLNYVGNAMVIGSAFWNSKINKFRFGRRNK